MTRLIVRSRWVWRVITLAVAVPVWLMCGLMRISAQQADVLLLSPQPGQAIQGLVAITGSIPDSGFTIYEVQFAYIRSNNPTWFLIHEGRQPLSEGQLAAWDTTTITDGTYDLRLVVYFADGSSQESVVRGVRVRNYSPVETDTPAPTTEFSPEPTRPAPTVTQTPFRLTVTPLPTNPAGLSGIEIAASIAQGSLVVVVFVVIIGLYFALRRLSSH